MNRRFFVFAGILSVMQGTALAKEDSNREMLIDRLFRDDSEGIFDQLDKKILLAVNECFEEMSIDQKAFVNHYGAYRTSAMNRECGGAPASYHLHGKAIDLHLSSENVQKVRSFWKENNLGSAVHYRCKGFVHVDLREESMSWKSC